MRFEWDEEKNRANDRNKPSETNWDRVDALTDDTVDTTDIAPLQESFFSGATLRMPRDLVAVTVKLDSDVVAWFKAQGGDWEQRLNAALRIYAESHKVYGKASQMPHEGAEKSSA